MSLTEKPKFLTGIIIALLLLNFGILVFLWTHHPGPHGPGGGPDVFHFMVESLKMNETQEKEYESLRDQHHSKVEELHGQIRVLHDDLFSMLHTASPDSMAVLKLTDSIAGLQKQIDLATFYHFKLVRSMCNPEQQKKFDEIIGEAMKMMAPPPPPSGRR